MNWLVTYPRSGTKWTTNRIEALIKAEKNLRALVEEGQKRKHHINKSHFGFHPNGGTEGAVDYLPSIKPGEKLFVLLRDVRAVSVSYWYFIQAHGAIKRKVSERYPSFFSNINSFLNSPFAAERFAIYLQRINQAKEDGLVGGIYFYEDIQTYDFIYKIPEILGVEYSIAEDKAKLVHNLSNERVNQHGTDYGPVDLKTLERIQDVLQKECVLEEYRNRYLDKP